MSPQGLDIGLQRSAIKRFGILQCYVMAPISYTMHSRSLEEKSSPREAIIQKREISFATQRRTIFKKTRLTTPEYNLLSI
jgi:hypothetical protein